MYNIYIYLSVSGVHINIYRLILYMFTEYTYMDYIRMNIMSISGGDHVTSRSHRRPRGGGTHSRSST